MATTDKPFSSIDWGLRGAAITGGASALAPLIAAVIKFVSNKKYRKNFKEDIGGNLGNIGTNMAVAGTLGAIPGGFTGYKLGKFINDSKEQQARLYRDQMLADYINQNGIPT